MLLSGGMTLELPVMPSPVLIPDLATVSFLKLLQETGSSGGSRSHCGVPHHSNARRMRDSFKVRDFLRSNKTPDAFVFAVCPKPPPDVAMEKAEEDAALAPAVREAVCTLSHRLRQIVWLFYYMDVSLEVIAEITWLPLEIVRYCLTRAHKLLRNQLLTDVEEKSSRWEEGW